MRELEILISMLKEKVENREVCANVSLCSKFMVTSTTVSVLTQLCTLYAAHPCFFVHK